MSGERDTMRALRMAKQGAGTMREPLRTFELPVKLDDDYPCRGTDSTGRPVYFDDLLAEGQRVATFSDTNGNYYGPFGTVERRADGLWIA